MSKKRAHSVTVRRRPSTADGDGRRNRTPAYVYGGDSGNDPVRGLMEPKKSEEAETEAGTVSQSRWTFTWWGSETLLPGDLVTWSLAGKDLVAEKLMVDAHRPGSRIAGYRVIELVESAS